MIDPGILDPKMPKNMIFKIKNSEGQKLSNDICYIKCNQIKSQAEEKQKTTH